MSAESLSVYDLMTRHPVTLAADDRLTVAADVMRLGRVRHLPVLDEDGVPIGILSEQDLAPGPLLRACGIDPSMEQQILGRVAVGEVMARRVSTTTPEASLRDAAWEMNRRKISCLPVVENGIVVGMLTERDFVVALVDPNHRDDAVRTEADRPEKESVQQRLGREYDRLRTVRDELRVKLHLAGMEMRERFESAERRWGDLEQHLVHLRAAGREPLEEAEQAARKLAEEIRAFYGELWEQLKRRP